jgi:hypothetical protein
VELRGVADEMVGGEDGEGRFGVAPLEEGRREPHGGGRVASRGLFDDVLGGQAVEVLPDQFSVPTGRHDEDLPGLEAGEQSFDRLADHGTAPQDGEDLLGPVPAGEGPEPRSAPPRHDDCVEVLHPQGIVSGPAATATVALITSG